MWFIITSLDHKQKIHNFSSALKVYIHVMTLTVCLLKEIN